MPLRSDCDRLRAVPAALLHIRFIPGALLHTASPLSVTNRPINATGVTNRPANATGVTNSHATWPARTVSSLKNAAPPHPTRARLAS